MQKIIFMLFFIMSMFTVRSQVRIVSVSPDTMCLGRTVTVTVNIHIGPDRSMFTDSLRVSGYVFAPDTIYYSPILNSNGSSLIPGFYFDTTMLNHNRSFTYLSNGTSDTGTFYFEELTRYNYTISGITFNQPFYNSDTFHIHHSHYPNSTIIVDSFRSICANSSINLTAIGSSNQGQYVWVYPNRNDTTYSQTVTVKGDSLWPYPYSNTYYCTYTDTSGHCGSATGTTNIMVKQTPIQDICVVTLDSTLSYNMLVWDKAQPTDTVSNALIDSFLIMRGSQQIASQPYSAYSTYTDYNADISLQAWAYSITAVDVCGLQTPSYYVGGITTMFQEQPNSGDVTWYPYMEGSNAISTTYTVLREAGGSSSWTLLDTVTAVSSPITIHDTSSVITPGTKYRVEGAGASCVARSAYTIYSNIATFEPNGIDQIGSDMLEVYPNPTEGLVHLSRSNLHITLSDMAGQKIDEIFNSGNTLNISWLTPGVYFLNSGTSTMKIVKL